MSLPAIIVFGTGAAIWSVLILLFAYWLFGWAIRLLANWIDRRDTLRTALNQQKEVG